MKLNRKGYMLVEIIVASVLAMTIAYYLLNLTYRFKDTNEDLYHSITYSTDKILVTKNIMLDLENGSVSNIIKENNTLTFTIKLNNKNIEEKRKLFIDGGKIQYGKVNESGVFDITDISYYEKTFESTLVIEEFVLDTSNSDVITIEIPMSSLYGEADYSIKLVAKVYNSVNEEEMLPESECELLSTKEYGSYVQYGVTGVEECMGTFYSTNTMLAYVEDNVPYLISAGAAYCGYIDGTVNASTVGSLYDNAKKNSVSDEYHYCNSTFAYGGECITNTNLGEKVDHATNTVWPMDTEDFIIITGGDLENCTGSSSNECGVGNVVMDNGNMGAYWIFPDYTTSNSVYKIRSWVGGSGTSLNWLEVNVGPVGIRYVYKLRSDVCVTSGSGTSDAPYEIAIK